MYNCPMLINISYYYYYFVIVLTLVWLLSTGANIKYSQA